MTPLVTITGARGALARAIDRRLREAGYDVEHVRQGDDVLDAVGRSQGVVVLDGAVGGNYRMALRAVAHAVEQVGSRAVVAVTVAPRRKRGRGSLKAEKGAEADVRMEGTHLRVIRAGFVVGSPRQPGPEGRGFALHWGRVWIPGRGSQAVRPIVIEDLAALVVEAVSEPAAGDLEAEGLRGCRGGADVRLYRHTAGHTWPGSPAFVELEPQLGPSTQAIDANELMWSFFRRHRLPA